MAKAINKEELRVMEEEEVVTVPLAEFDEDDVNRADEVIFPGGPTYSDIEEWKSLHGEEVYLTEFDDKNIFVWRPIRRKEYKDIQKIPNADEWYKEERVCDKVVLFPKNYGHMHMSNGKAGIPTLLSQMVLEKSGFVARNGAMRLT